jgi:tRNA-5-methyluridine54 2-sulfurtransferase
VRCRTCGERAVLNMREHKLALCKEHFLEWLPAQTEKAITHYDMFSHAEKVLVAVSGGKDSLSLWDILQRLGYAADGLYIDLGIQEPFSYSHTSQELCEKFAAARGLTLHVEHARENLGASIPEATRLSHRGRDKPCSICGLVKRHIMNRVAYEGGYSVLVTGHNLDDEAAVLMHNAMIWAGGYLARQSPVLPADRPGLARKTKPFCRLYERETAAYALLSGIEYIYEECPYAVGSSTIAYKEVLDGIETNQPGAKLQFYLSFLKAKKEGLFAPTPLATDLLHACVRCGQPTSAPEKCSFCRLQDSVAAHADAESVPAIPEEENPL